MAMVLRIIPLSTIYMKQLQFSDTEMFSIQHKDYSDSTLFNVKCLMKEYPFSFIIALTVMSIFTFSYLMRVAELPLILELGENSFQNYITVVWLVIITMTTVGYGDYFPRTQEGRLIAFITVHWGIFLVGLIVVVIFDVIDLSPEELLVLGVHNSIEMRK